MEIIKVVILSDVQETGFDIKSKIADESTVVVGFGGFDQKGYDKAESLYPHIIILANNSNANVFDIANKIYHNLPHCIVVLMCNGINLELMQQAMITGIRKVIPLDADAKTVKVSLMKCYELENSRKTNNIVTTPRMSRVISIFGGKGGIGKTTIAANIALNLVKQGKKVIIVDANLQMGDLHLHFDCEPKDTIGELVYEGNLNSIETIKSYICAHPSGLEIIASPKSPEFAEVVKPEHFQSIINTLRPYYDYIIIDLPPTFVDTTITCFENSDRILLVVGVDISSIRAARISMTILERLRQEDKICLILNRSQKAVINEKDVARVLSREINFKVSECSELALNSINKGIPVSELYPKSVMAKQLKRIADEI